MFYHLQNLSGGFLAWGVLSGRFCPDTDGSILKTRINDLIARNFGALVEHTM